MKKTTLAIAGIVIGAAVLAGCNDADVVSRNISNAADNFEIPRRIVFYNTQSDTYMLTMEGLCSLGNADKGGELSVTCKIGPGKYKKHFLGLSRNVTYLVEQMDGAEVSPYHYKVTFKPSQIIPDLEVK
jgi:predicted small secreted protein